MKSVVLCFIILSGAWQAVAQQFPSEIWHEGKVVLTNDQTYKGLIKYNLEGDLIQLNSNNTLQAYSSKKILYFEIFDEAVESYRQFYSLPYQVSEDYETPILFEVLYEGSSLTLLAREMIATESVAPYNSYYGRSSYYYTRNKLVYQYYFLDEKGQITWYSNKKRDLVRIMGKQSDEIKKFIGSHNLNVDRRRDLERITAYYNTLEEG
ncbi:MAG: hypothetical protein ACR2MX_02615 [Cyclobacteriaceae bacterium]